MLDATEPTLDKLIGIGLNTLIPMEKDMSKHLASASQRCTVPTALRLALAGAGGLTSTRELAELISIADVARTVSVSGSHGGIGRMPSAGQTPRSAMCYI